MGSELKTAVQLIKIIREKHSDYIAKTKDKPYFNILELKKEFMKISGKSDTFFRGVIENLEAWEVLVRVAFWGGKKYLFNEDNYKIFIKEFDKLTSDKK